MNREFTTFFLTGFVTALSIVAVLAFRKRFLCMYAAKILAREKKIFAGLVLCISVIATLISGALLVNDSYSRSSERYVSQKLGVTSGIIYPRTTDVWSREEANSIFASVSAVFESYLPVYQDTLQVTNTANSVQEDTIVMSYLPDLGRAYQSQRSDNQFPESTIDPSELVLAQSVASDLGAGEGDELIITFSEAFSYTFTIASVIVDNGLVGFSAPLPSRYFQYEGSVYISQEFLQQYSEQIYPDNAGANELYNAILVARTSDYERSSFQTIIQDQLSQYDNNLIFEELKIYLLDLTAGVTEGINFGKVSLLLSLLPIIIGIGIVLGLYLLLVNRMMQQLGTIELMGVRKGNIAYLFIFTGFLVTLIGSVVGIIAGWGLGYVYLEFSKDIISRYYETLDIASIISYYSSPRSVGFAFAGTWLALFLTAVLLGMYLTGIQFAVKMRGIRLAPPTRLRSSRSLLPLGGIGIAAGIVYYSFQGTSQSALRWYLIVLACLLLMWSVGFFLAYVMRPRKIFSVVAGVSTLVVLIFMLTDSHQGMLRTQYLFFLLDVVLLAWCAVILFVYNYQVTAGLISKVVFMFARLPAIVRLGLSLPFERKVSAITIVIGFALPIILTLFLRVAQVEINRVVAEVPSDIDVVVVDQYDRNNILPERANTEPDVASVIQTRVGGVYFPEFIYGDIETFEPAANRDVNELDTYQDTFFVVTPEQVENLEVKLWQESVQQSFFTSNKYIFLGENYSEKTSLANVHPGLELGDTVKLVMNGSTEITRIVGGIVEDEQLAGGFFQEVFAPGGAGVLLSEYDYSTLRQEKGVYASAFYGLDLQDGCEGIEVKRNLVNALEGTEFTNVVSYSEVEERSVYLVNQLFYLVYIVLLISMISGLLIVLVLFVQRIQTQHAIIQTLFVSGVAKRTIFLAFLLSSAALVGSALATGMVFGGVILYYTYTLDQVIFYELNLSQVMMETVGMGAGIVLISYILSALVLQRMMRKLIVR
ncbi:MAG: FtsX-like permease family protein [Candidatus Dojkabacteria bacterium]